MAKLWEKNYRLDALLEAFTVGDDWQIDAGSSPRTAWRAWLTR